MVLPHGVKKCIRHQKDERSNVQYDITWGKLTMSLWYAHILDFLRKSVVYRCINIEELVLCDASSKPTQQEQKVVVNGLRWVQTT